MIEEQQQATSRSDGEEIAAEVTPRNALRIVQWKILLLADFGDRLGEVLRRLRLISAIRYRQRLEETMEHQLCRILVGLSADEVRPVHRAQIDPVEGDSVLAQPLRDVTARFFVELRAAVGHEQDDAAARVP